VTPPRIQSLTPFMFVSLQKSEVRSAKLYAHSSAEARLARAAYGPGLSGCLRG
jgi:hypothetical protein